jgi:hypothetical protein
MATLRELLSRDASSRVPYYLTFAAAVAALCSNRACNLLIGAALAALLFSHFRFGLALRFPPVKLPLALFFVATVIAAALSGHALEGWPGIRKFYLCLMLLLVASTFRKLREVRALVIALTAVMSLSALWSIRQFWDKFEEARVAHQDFRLYYTPQRIHRLHEPLDDAERRRDDGHPHAVGSAPPAAPADTERRWILHGCVAVMLAALSAAMYEHNLGDGEVLTLFLTICACGYRAIEGDTVEVKGA